MMKFLTPAVGADLQGAEQHIGDAQYLLRSSLFWGALAGILIIVSYLWIDRPAAVLVHNVVRSKAPVQALCLRLSALPDLLTGLWIIIVSIVPFFLWAVTTSRITLDGRLQQLSVAACGSFLLSATAKMILKWSCGRTWPETWIYDNPSYIRDGVYGFFPLHGGAGWSSFPSGHMAAATTIVMIGWRFVPHLRLFWATIAIGAAIGLVAMNFHFVSDIVAGCYIGAVSSAIAIRLAALWYRRLAVRSPAETAAT
jgi:membrane-associated phospholipid phosphatase